MQHALDPMTRERVADALFVVGGSEPQVIHRMISVAASNNEPINLRNACLSNLKHAAQRGWLPDRDKQDLLEVVTHLARDPAQPYREIALETIGAIATIDDLSKIEPLLISPFTNQLALDTLWDVLHRHPDDAGRGAAQLAEFLALEYQKQESTLTMRALDVFSIFAKNKIDSDGVTALRNIARALEDVGQTHAQVEVRAYCQGAVARLIAAMRRSGEQYEAAMSPP
jgi:hypothetical protein